VISSEKFGVFELCWLWWCMWLGGFGCLLGWDL